jgi:large subunit ribosomal protein L10
MTTITKEKKKEIVEELTENISKQEAVFFVNYKGIKGNEVNQLREELRKNGAKMIVARKTLVKIAFEKEGVSFNPLELEGEVGFVFSFEDGINTAKIIEKFSKEEKLFVLGGIYENKSLTAEEVKELASLPSREELLSKLVGTMIAPVSGFLQVLEGNTRGLINVLNAKTKV